MFPSSITTAEVTSCSATLPVVRRCRYCSTVVFADSRTRLRRKSEPSIWGSESSFSSLRIQDSREM